RRREHQRHVFLPRLPQRLAVDELAFAGNLRRAGGVARGQHRAEHDRHRLHPAGRHQRPHLLPVPVRERRYEVEVPAWRHCTPPAERRPRCRTRGHDAPLHRKLHRPAPLRLQSPDPACTPDAQDWPPATRKETYVTTAREVVEFWTQAGIESWFNGGEAFDRQCRERFLDAHMAAARGEYAGWLENAEGALALMILLDQIPRNIFRGSGHAFATDGLALHYANLAVEAGHDRQVEPELRAFFYLPWEHSEDLADQRRAVELFTPLGNQVYTDYAIAHREVIERFGRFPH